MGWQEESENDEAYAPLTEDEMREFHAIREQVTVMLPYKLVIGYPKFLSLRRICSSFHGWECCCFSIVSILCFWKSNFFKKIGDQCLLLVRPVL